MLDMLCDETRTEPREHLLIGEHREIGWGGGRQWTIGEEDKTKAEDSNGRRETHHHVSVHAHDAPVDGDEGDEPPGAVHVAGVEDVVAVGPLGLAGRTGDVHLVHACCVLIRVSVSESERESVCVCECV